MKDTDPQFLSVLRAGRPEHTPDVEGATLSDHGDSVVLELSDGDTLEFDAAALRAALGVTKEAA
jgi:hypothetical protein